MHDSALDLLVMVLVLGLVVAIGFNTTIPIVNASKQLYYKEDFDKTVNKLEGDKAALVYDGCMTSDEIILATMGQTYFMPEPGYLEVGGEEIMVSNNMAFSPNSLDIGNQTKLAISTWFTQFRAAPLTLGELEAPPIAIADARFKIMFDMNDADDKDDDTYSVFILLTRLSTGKKELFKCDASGKLRDGGGNIL